MKRTPLQRKTWLNRSTPLTPVNRKRRKAKHLRNFDGGKDHDAFIRAQHCAVCGATTGIQACHVQARGMGGAKGSARDLIPLCASHHGEQGRLGWVDFGRRYGLTLEAARDLAASLWEANNPP